MKLKIVGVDDDVATQCWLLMLLRGFSSHLHLIYSFYKKIFLFRLRIFLSAFEGRGKIF
jgi:hypothetical protein